MTNKKIRIILDTNLWISFLITKNHIRLDKSIISSKSKLIFSEELLQEFISVVSRPKFKRYFSESDVSDILDFIENKALFIDVKSDIKMCRDEKDNFLLSLAIDGQADFLITGDDDLLSLNRIENTQIVTINQYLKISDNE
jgi:putative PIN family toxin of toxin-antitoxin system